MRLFRVVFLHFTSSSIICIYCSSGPLLQLYSDCKLFLGLYIISDWTHFYSSEPKYIKIMRTKMCPLLALKLSSDVRKYYFLRLKAAIVLQSVIEILLQWKQMKKNRLSMTDIFLLLWLLFICRTRGIFLVVQTGCYS